MNDTITNARPSRATHLRWCKDRALEYVAHGDYQNAINSMLSDMDKHPETKSPIVGALCLAALMGNEATGEASCRKFIEGFN